MRLLNKFLLTFIIMFLPLQEVMAKTKTTEQSFVIQKFVVAIVLVIFFAAVLYGVLYLYKKFFTNQDNTQIPDSLPKEMSLKSPNDFNEAIATFLEKTKPNQ